MRLRRRLVALEVDGLGLAALGLLDRPAREPVARAARGERFEVVLEVDRGQDLQDARVELDLRERLDHRDPELLVERHRRRARARARPRAPRAGAPAPAPRSPPPATAAAPSPLVVALAGRGLAACARAGALVLERLLELVADELIGDVLADDQRRVPVLGDVRGAELLGLLERRRGRTAPSPHRGSRRPG